MIAQVLSKQRWLAVTLAAALLVRICLLSWRDVYDASTSSKRKTQNAAGYVRAPQVFGHLHYAKTAGTDINSRLASRYERVCGHKGYSYDHYQYNRKIEEWSYQNPSKRVPEAPPFKNHSDVYQSAYTHPGGFSRGRVPTAAMWEIGFEDCDYISLEDRWQEWPKVAEALAEVSLSLELHVLCRDPLEHLMSQCNFMKIDFQCDAPDLYSQVLKCMGRHKLRFHKALDSNFSTNLQLKCFSHSR